MTNVFGVGPHVYSSTILISPHDLEVCFLLRTCQPRQVVTYS